MKNRSRTDIISTILIAATGGATKTRLMYGAYLSYAQITEYLAFLGEKELIHYEGETQKYQLTEKGMGFILAYEQISELVSVSNMKSMRSIQPTAESVTSSIQGSERERKSVRLPLRRGPRR
jgi:predicted transcriptional regulator